MAGKQNDGGIFNNWLKNFTITVFMQSFHAIFLLFSLFMLSAIQKMSNANGNTAQSEILLGFMGIVCFIAIIKFEKLIKDLFGIKDSLAGGFKGAMKTAMAIKSAGSIAKRLADPIKKTVEGKRSLDQKRRSLQELGAIPATNGAHKDYYNHLNEEGMELVKSRKQAAKQAIEDSKKIVGEIVGNVGQDYDSDSKYQEANNNHKINVNTLSASESAERNKVIQGGGKAAAKLNIDTNKNDYVTYKEKEKNRESMTYMNKSIDEYNKELQEYKKNRRDSWLNMAGTIGTIGMGIGMTDEFSEAVTAASIINVPVDAASTAYASHSTRKEAFKATGSNQFYSSSDSKNFIKGVEKDIAEANKHYQNDVNKAVEAANHSNAKSNDTTSFTPNVNVNVYDKNVSNKNARNINSEIQNAGKQYSKDATNAIKTASQKANNDYQNDVNKTIENNGSSSGKGSKSTSFAPNVNTDFYDKNESKRIEKDIDSGMKNAGKQYAKDTAKAVGNAAKKWLVVPTLVDDFVKKPKSINPNVNDVSDV